MTVLFHSKETIFNLKSSEYFKQRITNLIHNYDMELLGWLSHDDEGGNYYTLSLSDNPNIEVTPFLLVKRDFLQKNPFILDHECYTYKKVSFINNLGHEQTKLVKMTQQEIENYFNEFPYLIITIGCDDSNLAWYFTSKEEYQQFFDELKNLQFDCTFYTFLDIYHKNLSYW